MTGSTGKTGKKKTIAQPPVGTIFRERWRLEGIIGQGGFGSVYIGTDLTTNQVVAVKVQDAPKKPSDSKKSSSDETCNPPEPPEPQDPQQAQDSKKPQSKMNEVGLEIEALFYDVFSNNPGIATLHDNGTQDELQFMVCELLGATLQNLFYHCGRQFSLKTTLLLADQLLIRLQVFHSLNILHRDVKPDNVAMGFGREKGKVAYLVDFGLLGGWTQDDDYVTAPDYGFMGSYTWASIASHLGRAQSPKDDLESLAYMLIYFARGWLPWQEYTGVTEASTVVNDRLARLKLTLPVELICGDLPSEFARHLKYVRSLKFNDTPNYLKLRQMYWRLMARLGHHYDNVFDWDVQRANGINVKLQLPQVQPQPQQQQQKQQQVAKQLAFRETAAVIQEKVAEKVVEEEPVPKPARKRKIVFVKKTEDEGPPPKRQRGKPARVAEKKEKDVAKKAPVKRAPVRKQPARGQGR